MADFTDNATVMHLIAGPIDDLDEIQLFWSNEDGWVDHASATRFKGEEMDQINLPFEAVGWVVAADQLTLHLWDDIDAGSEGASLVESLVGSREQVLAKAFAFLTAQSADGLPGSITFQAHVEQD